MLNTYVVTRDERQTFIDNTDKKLEISQTSPDSKFIHCTVGDECYKHLLTDEPFLYRGEEDTVQERAPYTCKSLYYTDVVIRKTTTKLIHGVTVLQVKLNGDRAIIEYIDCEREPKVLKVEYVDEFI